MSQHKEAVAKILMVRDLFTENSAPHQVLTEALELLGQETLKKPYPNAPEMHYPVKKRKKDETKGS